MRNRLLAVAFGAVVLVASAAPGHSTPSTATSASSKMDEHLVAALAEDPDEVDVIVTTVGDPNPAADAAEDLGAATTWRYDLIAGFAGRMPVEALPILAERADVERLWLDRPLGPVMDVSHQAIEAPKVWDTGVTGEGITVAIIDTGIDQSHPWFDGAVVECLSLIAGIESPECFDLDGHGTHVAGTVASRNDTYPGIAPAANLAAIRTLHGPAGLSSDSIAAMEWIAENGDSVEPPIRVANMSLGPIDPRCGTGDDPSSEAANALVDAGVVVAIAAGNSGHEECTIDGAAAATKVLTVGAVDDHDTVTQDDETIYENSSGGPTADGRLKPDITFPGVEIWSATLYSQGVLISGLTGTSMATPHAAGTAALLVDADPGLTPADVKARITDSAYEPTNGAAGDLPNNVWGHGVGNACRAMLLTTCTVPFVEETTASIASVDAVGANSSHTGANGNGPHEITVTATVVDDEDERVEGAEVSFRLLSPDGTEHTGTATTDSAGVAVLTVHAPRGHGTWEGCVTDVAVSGHDYSPEANRQTCESFEVT